MAVTLSCFFYKIVLTATHSLLVLMKALSFASVVTNQEQVKLMTLHVVYQLRLVNEGVGVYNKLYRLHVFQFLHINTKPTTQVKQTTQSFFKMYVLATQFIYNMHYT